MTDNISKILNTAEDSRNSDLEIDNIDLYVNTSKPTVHKLQFTDSAEGEFKDYVLDLLEELDTYTYELEGNNLRIESVE